MLETLIDLKAFETTFSCVCDDIFAKVCTAPNLATLFTKSDGYYFVASFNLSNFFYGDVLFCQFVTNLVRLRLNILSIILTPANWL